jgi:hypothetical protein
MPALRSDAMAMVGHLTESIHRRYAISDETSLRESAVKLAALHDSDREARRAKVQPKFGGTGGREEESKAF